MNLLDHGRDHGYFAFMKAVSKSRLKARMLEYFREVERTGEPLIVTDHGREVLEVRPVGGKRRLSAADVQAWYRAGPGSGKSPDDAELLKPAAGADWEVLKADDRNPWRA